MLKENQKIEINWNPQQASHFRKLGYNFEKGDTIWVSPNELQDSSHKRVQVLCDKCSKELGMEYRQYTHKRIKFGGKYYCDACASGAEETLLKRRLTCLKKYGVENPMKDQEIAAKNSASCYKNGSIPTSSQQLKIYETLKKYYNSCFLNFPVRSLSLDCMVETGTASIDIEYDGWYWHQDQLKDAKRDRFIQSVGYKILRIKSGREVPSEKQLLDAIYELENSDKNYSELILEDYKEREKRL